MTMIQDDFEGESSLKYERLITALFVMMIVAFMMFDIVEDWLEGASFYHTLPESLVAIFGMGTAALLFLRFAKTRTLALTKARREVALAKTQAQEWQSQTASFREGLTNAISKQIEEWGMTESEKDICFFLLKGFSLQEIAELRKTSERTVRQQASVIYKKSGLSGRVQLAAFFLEDLLVPLD